MVEEKFLITEQEDTVGKLLDGMECQILLDTGASKSFMSKLYFLHVNIFTHYQSLHQRHREFK